MSLRRTHHVRGIGLVEICIASVIFIGILFVVFSVLRTGSSSSTRSVATDQSSRAVTITFDTMVHDFQSAVVVNPTTDLVVAADQQSITMSVATGSVSSWTVPQSTVKYYTQPDPQNSQWIELVREQSGKTSVCADGLTAVNFQTVAPNSTAPYRAAVAVTLAPHATTAGSRVESMSFTVNVAVPPSTYLWIGALKS